MLFELNCKKLMRSLSSEFWEEKKLTFISKHPFEYIIELNLLLKHGNEKGKSR